MATRSVGEESKEARKVANGKDKTDPRKQSKSHDVPKRSETFGEFRDRRKRRMGLSDHDRKE